MTIYGYARVSTVGQTLESQLNQLTAAGCTHIYCEKLSGATTNRPELARTMRRIKSGDVMMVTRLDRLARSTLDLLNILAAVSKKGASLKSLAEPWTDTASVHGRLMVTLIAGFAEYERAMILARTSDGRALAVARGVRLGRPSKLSPTTKHIILARRDAGEHLSVLADAYGVDATTISRICAKAARSEAVRND